MSRQPSNEGSFDSTDLSAEGSLISTQEDDEAYHLPYGIPYLEEVTKFITVKQNENFNIKPSWSGMNIRNTTKDQLDMQILAQRVDFILENAATQAKIVVALPKLLENNGEIIRKWMNTRDADFVTNCFTKWNTTPESSRLVRTVGGFPVHKNLKLAYRLLCMNKCLPLYVQRYPPVLPPYVRVFINALAEFGVYVCKHMELTAAEMVAKDAKLKMLFEVQHERSAELKRLQRTVTENNAEFDAKIGAKDEQIYDMEEQLNDTMNHFHKMMQDVLYQSDKTLYHSGEASMLEQAELSEAAKNARTTYATTLESHLNEERMLRTRKIKYESQLAIWLSKYDTDVGEKQHILDEMTEGYEKESAEYQELECLMVEQEKVYTRYLDEQDEDEYGETRTRLYEIASQRAARIIQKYWRAYLKRKLNRKSRTLKMKAKLREQKKRK